MIALAFLAHFVGDYLFQSDWMASEKTKRWWPAVAHALTYGLPFLVVTRSIPALVVIVATHAVIDHYRLARHVVWAKNQLAPKDFRYPWSHGDTTGYHNEVAPYQHDGNPEGCTATPKPMWMSVWLMIIADNTLHMLINVAAITWL